VYLTYVAKQCTDLRCIDQLGWLHTFLKIYIRAFQQASDLDDTVEEKLLVGDRPKQTNDPGRPLKERLVQRVETRNRMYVVVVRFPILLMAMIHSSHGTRGGSSNSPPPLLSGWNHSTTTFDPRLLPCSPMP
jgi:hypothetical protein